MRSFVRLYWLCLKRAFPGAWAAAWISSSALTIIAGSIAIFWSPFGTAMNLLVGLIPLAIFVGIMIAGPLAASFRVLQEQQAEIANLRAKLTERPRFEDETRAGVQKELAKLDARDREAIKLILTMGPQSSSDLITYIRSIGHSFEGDPGTVTTGKCGLLQRDFEGRWEIKQQLRRFVEELI